MKIDCDCNYCKNKVNEYFCNGCLYNFNRCECYNFYHETQGDLPSFGLVLCPKCHPKDVNWEGKEGRISKNHKE